MNPTNPIVVDTSRSRVARLKPVPINAVTLSSQLEQLEKNGCRDNFRRAAADAPTERGGYQIRHQAIEP